MATSPNYAWAEPDNSSLVKNGAADIRTLGDAIDTSVWNVGYGQAGKNKVINGAMNVWQRGITFNSAADGAYTADRFQFFKDGTATCNVTQTTFTPGSAPVAGYESQYYLTLTPASYTSGNIGIRQNIEDVRTFAGQTVTISFYAKASASTSNTILYLQNFGSGGSASVNASAGTVTIGTGWTRHTVSVTIPSVSGKTIGASSYLQIQFLRYASNATIDIWGVQVEYGSKMTPFQTASQSIQGELAMCQRYLPAIIANNNNIFGFATSTTLSFINCVFPVTARVTPTGITIPALSNFSLFNYLASSGTPTAIAFDNAGTSAGFITVTTTAGSPTLVGGNADWLRISNANGYILFTGCEL
jgi:hypothetical protein